MSLRDLAQELKDMIIEHLAIRSLSNGLRTLRTKLSPEQMSNKIWSEFLEEDNKWIPELLKHGSRPILIGDGLNHIDYGHKKTLHISLVTNDPWGDIIDPGLLLKSLRCENFRNEPPFEVFFADSNVILDISGHIQADVRLI
jgi:hypothetical protein